jgi:hypothetical protein
VRSLFFIPVFFLGQKFNRSSSPVNSAGFSSNFNNKHSIIQKESNQKAMTVQKKEQLDPVTRSSLAVAEPEDLSALPPEQENPMEARFARENLFIELKKAELTVLEDTLASMQENDFPKEEIESMKQQIAALESAKFEDNEPEQQSDSNENMTPEMMRKDLFESLKQNSDLSDEEREQMVYAMFPDEDEGNALINDEPPGAATSLQGGLEQ